MKLYYSETTDHFNRSDLSFEAVILNIDVRRRGVINPE